jgi:radical SAM protein with 4Fe4S-binding SPASM domain
LVEIREVGADSLKVSRFLAQRDPLDLLAEKLGENFVRYRLEWDLAKTFQYLPPFPLHVDYELKNECGLRCPMCPNGFSAERFGPRNRDHSELKTKKALELIKEGAALGQRSMGFGGLWEPLTCQSLPDLVAAGRELGFVDAMLNTNGQFLTRRKSRDLIDSGLTRLMVSVDAATAETYRLARPGGDFQLLENNILEFLAVRAEMGRELPVLRLSFCLTSLNEGELEAFLRKWEKKVDFFSVQSYGRFDKAAPALFPRENPLPAPGGRCAQPQKRLAVQSDGTVAPCCDLSGRGLNRGNVDSLSLAEIWAGAEIREIRARLSGPRELWPPNCQDCQAKYA